MKLNSTDSLATTPMSAGIIAPPTIAMTNKPESSLLRSGIVSIKIEKINGKTLANEIPARNIDTRTTGSDGTKVPRSATTPTSAVDKKNFFGER